MLSDVPNMLEIFQARVLEWVAIAISRRSSWIPGPGLLHCKQTLLPSELPGKLIRDVQIRSDQISHSVVSESL